MQSGMNTGGEQNEGLAEVYPGNNRPALHDIGIVQQSSAVIDCSPFTAEVRGSGSCSPAAKRLHNIPANGHFLFVSLSILFFFTICY